RDAAARLEGLLADVGDDDWGVVAGQLPLLWLLAGEISRARAAAEDVLADERSSDEDRRNAELVLIPALNLVGRPLSAIARAAEVLPRLAGDPALNAYLVGQIDAAVATGHRYAGDLARAEQEARRAYERATREEAGMLRGVYALRLGQVALFQGR